MREEKLSNYKIAPTFLYNSKGESKVFRTQEEVDKAWEEGWFGPPWLKDVDALKSTLNFRTKAELLQAVVEDSRYDGVKVNASMSVANIREALEEWELEHIAVSEG
jgi:hypothetical protein